MGLGALLVALAALAGAARADVGVMSASQRTAAPGEEMRVTLGCGFCFPPCVGPKGEKHPEGFAHGGCMLGTHGAPPPRSFGVSLVVLEDRPRPHRCGPDALCPPVRARPPRNGPYTYLGLATPPPGGNDPSHGAIPRYSLDFEVPRLAPGTYLYVIWCDACAEGRDGGLVVDPHSRRWRLHVAPGGRPATASIG